MTKDEKKHLDSLARLGCSLCRYVLGYYDTPAEIHHIRKAGKRKTAPCIPLCPEHHRGNTGIHGLGRKQFESRYSTDEETLLQKTLDLINETRTYQKLQINKNIS